MIEKKSQELYVLETFLMVKSSDKSFEFFGLKSVVGYNYKVLFDGKG